MQEQTDGRVPTRPLPVMEGGCGVTWDENMAAADWVKVHRHGHGPYRTV
jgi:hypothetical protein